MVGAAPTHAVGAGRPTPRRRAALLATAAVSAFVVLVLLPAGAAGAREHARASTTQALPRLWAVQVSTGAHGWFDRSALESVRKEGINAIAVRVAALGPKAAGSRTFDSIRAFAKSHGLYLIAVLPAGKPRTPAAVHASAACTGKRFAKLRCAVQARSTASAAKLARVRSSTRPLVVVYVRGPQSVSALTRLPASLRRRILVIASLYERFDASAWSAAIGRTAASAALNLGVAPRTRHASLAVHRFAALLHGSAAAGATDTQAPSKPAGLGTGSVHQTSLTLSWTASTDNVAVAGYRLYVDGNQAGTSGSTSYSFTGLSCGTSYSLGVSAYDGAGNASAMASISAATASCTSPPPPPSGQVVMAFDLGWDPTSNMPWNDLTQAYLFDLATENGPGLDTSNVDGVNIPAWVAAAHAHKVQAFISIGGDGDQNWQNACDDSNRAQFVTNLVHFATSHGFDGIDLDIEDGDWLGSGPPTPAMTTCIEAVATAAHAAGLLLSADVITNWDGYWFAPSESYVDQYNLMTYGDDLSTMKSDVLDTFEQGLPYAKMVVGVDVADDPEPSGGCGQFATYAAQAGLMGSFVWAAQPDTNNACMNQLAAASG